LPIFRIGGLGEGVVLEEKVSPVSALSWASPKEGKFLKKGERKGEF
jgi:hypothetical protein